MGNLGIRVLSSLRSVAGFSFADRFFGNTKRSLAHDAKLACLEIGKTRLPSHPRDSATSRNLPPHGQRLCRDGTILRRNRTQAPRSTLMAATTRIRLS